MLQVHIGKKPICLAIEKKILLVDDDQDILDMLKYNLSK